MPGLDFDLDFEEVNVTIRDNKDGTEHRYVLREFDGAGRDMYLNAMGKKMRHDATGKPAGLKDYNEIQALLVCRCMFPFGEKAAVDIGWVQTLPSRKLQLIFKECQRICGLDDEAEAEAKKN